MEYLTYSSDNDLGTFVKCYWTLSVPGEGPKEKQQVLSDGCMDMIFNLGDDVHRILPGDRYLVQPRSFILGQIIQPMWIRPVGEVKTFAVRFRPGCFAYFTNTPMTDLADKDTDLSMLFDGDKVHAIESAIQQAKDTPERIGRVEDFLLGLLEEGTNVQDLVKSVIDRILQTHGSVSIKSILKEHPGQRRKLERKFASKWGPVQNNFASLSDFRRP